MCHQHSRYLISCSRVFANQVKYRSDLKMLATIARGDILAEKLIKDERHEHFIFF